MTICLYVHLSMAVSMDAAMDMDICTFRHMDIIEKDNSSSYSWQIFLIIYVLSVLYLLSFYVMSLYTFCHYTFCLFIPFVVICFVPLYLLSLYVMSFDVLSLYVLSLYVLSYTFRHRTRKIPIRITVEGGPRK
jgi:hypothetical protein